MKRKKLGESLVYFCFILMGILVIVVVLNELSNDDKFIKDAEYTVAEVSNVVHKDGKSNSIYYIKYTVDGEEYEVESAAVPYATNIGERVGIYNDREKPKSICLKRIIKNHNINCKL